MKQGKILIAMVLLGAGLLAGCNSKADNSTDNMSETPETPVTEVSNTPAAGDARATIEEIFAQLESDYLKYLVQEDEPMFEFFNNRSDYIHSFLQEMEGSASAKHLSEGFLNQLEGDMENCPCDGSDMKSVRSCAEPIFRCERIMGKIEVIAIDAEFGEAVVLAHLKHPTTGETACEATFMMQEMNGTWMIMSRELEERASELGEVPASAVGYYIHTSDPTHTYEIRKEGDKHVLEFCIDGDCDPRGTILGTRPEGKWSALVIEGVEGEMVPTWTLDGDKLFVHDYDAESDSWTDAEYKMN